MYFRSICIIFPHYDSIINMWLTTYWHTFSYFYEIAPVRMRKVCRMNKFILHKWMKHFFTIWIIIQRTLVTCYNFIMIKRKNVLLYLIWEYSKCFMKTTIGNILNVQNQALWLMICCHIYLFRQYYTWMNNSISC